MKQLILKIIWLYQTLISPLTPPSCRFYPSCSCYAKEAIERYGCLKGGWMASKRLARCNPFTLGGYDPVPVEEEGLSKQPISQRKKNSDV